MSRVDKFFLIFLIGFFLTITNTYALSFTDVNDTSHDVTDVETLRDYCYFKYKKDNFDTDITSLIVGRQFSYYYCSILHRDISSLIFYTTNNQLWISDGSRAVNGSNYIFYSDFSFKQTSGANSLSSTEIVYSSVDIYDTYDSNRNKIFSSNFTFQDIENKYPKINNTSTNVDIDFPITKEEYYVLLMMLSTLIMMLFFKWCFPFKGGKRI